MRKKIKKIIEKVFLIKLIVYLPSNEKITT